MLPSLAIAASLVSSHPSAPRAGFEPLSPGRWSMAALELRHEAWLDARLLAVSGMATDALGVESRYLIPLSVTLSEGVPVVPGVELRGRLDLTLSLWQTTFERESPGDAPPLLLCSSGSIVEGMLGVTVARAVTLALLAGVQDDPVHLDDGADCLGGGPVWQSSHWVGALTEVQLPAALRVSLAVGRSEHHVHVAVHEHGAHGSGDHEHVAVRGVSALAGRAWLTADW